VECPYFYSCPKVPRVMSHADPFCPCSGQLMYKSFVYLMHTLQNISCATPKPLFLLGAKISIGLSIFFSNLHGRFEPSKLCRPRFFFLITDAYALARLWFCSSRLTLCAMSDSQGSLNPQVLDHRLVNKLYDDHQAAILRWSAEFHRIPSKTNSANRKSEFLFFPSFVFLFRFTFAHDTFCTSGLLEPFLTAMNGAKTQITDLGLNRTCLT
jgi:hypothetical protein